MNAESIASTPKVVAPAKAPRLDDTTWERLLMRIREEKCTPVIGSAACTMPPSGADPGEWTKLKYPSKEQIALRFAAKHGYPLDDRDKLERVARYVAATVDNMAPREGFAEDYRNLPTPNFSELPNEPHRVLADLPFLVYLTSNFDDWMYRALKEYKQKDARLAICRWNKHIPESAPRFDPDFAYTVANPLVYHFHGCMPWVESAVVTEDDYFEFLINVSRDNKLLTHRVERAIGGCALLFLGYSLSDWDFMVLFRLFAKYLRESAMTHIAVQLEPSDAPGQAQRAANAVRYLNSYFGSVAQIKIYWGTCQEFCEELRLRWEAFGR